MIIPVFILIGMINTSGAQECGVNGILDVDRKSQQTVNCDGSPFEGKGVASTNAVNYVAVGQQVYSGAAACAGCHGANGGGGVGPSFIVELFIQHSQPVQIMRNGYNLDQLVGRPK